jgi:bifunctional non-homologous end joining protein LigD
MPLARFDAPFEHPDWIFEPKLDGFRAVAYVEDGACRLVSRNRNAFKTFEPLAQAIGREFPRRSAILDGEIVRPGPDGRPMFYELMRRRGPFCFYAFDLLWLDDTDLRGLALSGRKALLRKLLPWKAHAVRYVEHVANGTDLFRVICDRDMEGIVAKQASAGTRRKRPPGRRSRIGSTVRPSGAKTFSTAGRHEKKRMLTGLTLAPDTVV